MKTLIVRKWFAALALAVFMAVSLWNPLVSFVVAGICVPVALQWSLKQLKEQARPPLARQDPPRGLATVLRLMYLVVRSVVRFFAKRAYRLLVFLILMASFLIFSIFWCYFHATRQESGFGMLIGCTIVYCVWAVWYAICIGNGTCQQFWQHVLKYYP